MKHRCVPRKTPTLVVVLPDGTIERVGFRTLRMARAAARSLVRCRCAFAMMR